MRLPTCFTVATIALSALGCDRFKSPPDPVRPFQTTDLCGGELRPLNTAEIAALNVKPELLGLLPRGTSTPVSLVGGAVNDESPAELTGVGLPVSAVSARLVLHSLWRAASRLKEASPPLIVLFPGAADSDRLCLLLLTGHRTEDSVLRMGDLSRSGASLHSYSALLDRWKTVTGMRLAAVDEGWLEVEFDQLPEDPTPLVTDLLNFTYAGDIDADTLQREVSDRRAVRLSF